jgi:hypothetical protein
MWSNKPTPTKARLTRQLPLPVSTAAGHFLACWVAVGCGFALTIAPGVGDPSQREMRHAAVVLGFAVVLFVIMITFIALGRVAKATPDSPRTAAIVFIVTAAVSAAVVAMAIAQTYYAQYHGG